MNTHVYCHEHAWRLCFQFFAKKKRFYQGMGSVAGSYYNFIFNIMGNNSVLHSNYTILNSFQLSTRVKIPPDLYRHFIIFLFVCSCVCLSSVQGCILLWFGWVAVNVGFHFSMWVCLSRTLKDHCFGKLFSPEDPTSWLLHLQRAAAHSENTCKKIYKIFSITFF